MDSDGNGYGDLEGIRSRLDYIKNLGFNTIWISPVFCSEFEDGGYDITDFYKIDPRFGTNTDLVNLVNVHMQRVSRCASTCGRSHFRQASLVSGVCEWRSQRALCRFYIWTKGKKTTPPKPKEEAG